MRPRHTTLVDLFSGCGGFSLGAHQAGFTVAAAIDIDPILTSTFPLNFPDTRLLNEDISTLDGEAVRAAAGGRVDGIFGGPPCQGFSMIGRREPDDPRSLLVHHFFRIVQEVRPAFFVMENVRGLGHSNSRAVLETAVKLVEDRYAISGPQILDAADFGAATRRERLFLIGINKDCGEPLNLEEIARLKRPAATVRAAISDLEGAEYLRDEAGFDVWRIARRGRPSNYASALRGPEGRFTGHRATDHSKEVVRRFKTVPPGGTDIVGRHHRLDWLSQCPTLRAGTGADKGSYQSVRPLHPEEPRVITVREAARLQGFPDTHRFHPTVWHSFRMIGNSVSPIIAQAIFAAIASRLDTHLPIAENKDLVRYGPPYAATSLLADVSSQGQEHVARGAG
jgi:DNA (cytosine-5)-methyltransferase 1